MESKTLGWGWSLYMLPGSARRVDRRRMVRMDSSSYYLLAGSDGVVAPSLRRAWDHLAAAERAVTKLRRKVERMITEKVAAGRAAECPEPTTTR